MQNGADAIHVLIDLNVQVDDNNMSDLILEVLEREFRLTGFLFFQSTRINLDYHRLIADIQVNVNTFHFKMKYGERNKTHKVNISKRSETRKEINYHWDFCNKSGYTADYCYSNPRFVMYKEPKVEDKPNIQQHATFVANSNVPKLRNKVAVDSRASVYFFCDTNLFVGNITPCSDSLECASGILPITGIGTVTLEITEAVITIDNNLYAPHLNINLFPLAKLETKGVRHMYAIGTCVLKLNSVAISHLESSSGLITIKLA